MKRFFGLVLSLVGGAGVFWAGYIMFTKSSETRLDPLPINALIGSLASVVILTLGLLWARD